MFVIIIFVLCLLSTFFHKGTVKPLNFETFFLVFKRYLLGADNNFFFLQVWWQYATLFVFISLYTLDTFTHHSFINVR